jgi:hypothetical protein
MVNAIYKYEESTNVFYVQFSNTLVIWPDYKEVNASYHLENSIKKALSIAEETKKTNPKLPEISIQVKVTDSKNDYLRIIALVFVQFAKGLGVTKINTEGF